jgi:hypothetical protein
MALGGLSFSDGFRSRSAGSMSGGAAAAGNASVAETFGALEATKPDTAGMGATAVEAESYKRRAASAADAATRKQALNSIGSVVAYDKQMTAAEKAAAKKASAATSGAFIKAGVGLLGAVAMSDQSTKNSIEHIEDALTTLRNLRPVTFYYNEEYSSSPERLHHGFVAQEYQKVMPDATYFDESTGKLCIDTGDLIGLLVRAVQQLETKVIRMEAANALVGV